MRPIFVLGLLLVLPQAAHAFLFEFEALDVTGNLEFHDDFEDGNRLAAPTSSLLPNPGTPLAFIVGSVETESGGALRLTGHDEAPLDGTLEGAWLSSFVPDSDVGLTTVAWSVRTPGAADPAALFMGFLQETDIFGTPIPGGPGAGFVLGWDLASGMLAIEFVMAFDVLATELVDPGTVTGTLEFEIQLDHAANTMNHRFSTDGGTTWIDPLAALAVEPGSYGVLFYAADVPEPGPIPMLSMGLAAMATRRAFRTGACGPPRRGHPTSPA